MDAHQDLHRWIIAAADCDVIEDQLTRYQPDRIWAGFQYAGYGKVAGGDGHIEGKAE